MHKFSEEEVFILSTIACIFPFIFVIVSFFETAEPYNYLVFGAALMDGLGILPGTFIIIFRLLYPYKFPGRYNNIIFRFFPHT